MISLDRLQPLFPEQPVYDELTLDGITPRPHWAGLVNALDQIGDEELARRWARAQRRIHENGVTYNVYRDPMGTSRPWEMDAIPLLIEAEEWQRLERGIIQRARLISLILADVYGPRRLLATGEFPPEFLFANPSFLRPLVGLEVPPQSYLHLMAVDLARSPDGQWWVLADRTQAPSGAGYALENRTIVSNILPDLFRESNVLRLAPFFRAQRNALMHLASSDEPRVVLLTPGPYNETYFEHSYLARYLSFTLVEGADLTVRDRRVYLKTVGRLEPVDVILRRVDDTFCDPLELRGDSFLGVAGLVDAIAAGNVVVANALGSGVVETSAIMPFLPGLSRKLLSEPLDLPSVATWWCGQEYALKWVLEHLDQVVIKPAFPARGMEPVFGADLPKAEKEKLGEMLRGRPYEYVGQEQVALSTAPVWQNGRLVSRSLVLRTYVLNTGNDWLVMPGGLARVASADGPVVSMQRGGHSKDAWVLSRHPVDRFSLLRPRDEPVELRRASAVLPSRAADNLFWVGRYAERADAMARLLRCMAERAVPANPDELSCLLQLHGCLNTAHSKLPKAGKATATQLESEILSLILDRERPDSLPSTLSEVNRIGNNVRERLSLDMMRLIGQLAHAMEPEREPLFVGLPAMLTTCLELLSAFSGLERENITRGTGWFFLTIGRRLERGIQTARRMQELVRPLDERSWPILEYLLEISDSSMTYRSRYYTSLQPAPVLDVLMLDEANPRSLAFQLSHIADLYGKLPRFVPSDLEEMEEVLERLRAVDLQPLSYPSPRSGPPHWNGHGWTDIQGLLEELSHALPAWSDKISENYFSHARTFAIRIGG
jgi:uncharacterized circularly permuted ATP-grasp superfamily protein/uncharacterized alpha-E superfamily protein